MGHRFHPDHMDRLLGEERRGVLPPDRIIDLLAPSPADTVADIGAGPGYFTLPLAKRTQGTVYAIDVEPRMLEALQSRWPGGMPARVRPLIGAADDLPLPDGSVDRLLYSLVLHEVDALDEALQEARRVLRLTGRMVVIEWHPEATEQEGPPKQERLNPDRLAQRMMRCGLKVESLLDVSAFHYALVAAPQTHAR
ncbi:methyltransferase domain-containing protein [Kyrpidia sp.]|uniref:class I SAM-dependent methyltransferase n=1 Tax=Kyrpidia sp. TaxID=2073077 RepID=UPI00258E05E2|nr:methyltransferase domain-containing protein [Kyrpidia sp.]MCL6575093.1 methyltransferase domain-containing protein [Kyrpidia sp.]